MKLLKNLFLLLFGTKKNCYGVKQTIELKENGANIPVTDENKQEYVDLMVEY